MEEGFSFGSLVILEYKCLKQEQLVRISTRDNLIYVTLASLAAVAAATLQLRIADLLLLLPPACLILGWTYLVNDQKVSAIGHHIRTVLVPQIRAELGNHDAPVLAWEFHHRADARRRIRKGAQLGIDLITFCLPALTAVVIHVVITPLPTLLTVVSAIEFLGTLLLGWAIVDNADLARSPFAWQQSAARRTDDDGPASARS